MAKLWLRRLSRLLLPHKILSLLKIYLCLLRNFPRCFFEQSWCDYMLTLWVNFNYIWMVFSLTRLNPCTDPIGTSTTLKSLSGFQFFQFLVPGPWYQVRDPWFDSQVWSSDADRIPGFRSADPGSKSLFLDPSLWVSSAWSQFTGHKF